MSRKQRNKPQHYSNGHSTAKSLVKPKTKKIVKPLSESKSKAGMAKSMKKNNGAKTVGIIPSTGVAKKRACPVNVGTNTIDLKQANKKSVPKDKGKGTDVVQGMDKCVFPTTGVAKKRKSSAEKCQNDSIEMQQNGAKLRNALPTKKRRKDGFSVASNSEEEDYMDQFFDDVSDDAFDVASDQSEDYDDYDDYDDAEEDVSDDEEGAMPFNCLVEYYGNRRDLKKTKGKVQIPTASTKGWIVEDNDQNLQYETENDWNVSSDEEVSVAKDKVKFSKTKIYQQHKQGVGKGPGVIVSGVKKSSKGKGKAREEEDSAEDTSESDSELWTDSLDEFQSDDDYSDGTEDSGKVYLNQFYDSDSYDEDYEPSEYDDTDDDGGDDDDDEVIIPLGQANIFDFTDNSIKFDEGRSQIIELPRDYVMQGEEAVSEKKDSESDASVPDLVPIYTKEGEFIDSPELLKNHSQSTSQSVAGGGVQEKDDVAAQEESTAMDVEESSNSLETDKVDTEMEPLVNDHRFYDAVDRRMALGVLMQPIYFYGHVTVQALFGQVEIMGYRFEKDEARTVYAARGYNAVNLSPLPPSLEAFNKGAFEQLVDKFRPHFTEADLRELIESFDPNKSVLVMLQPGSIVSGDSLVGTLCNYLEEYNLFPLRTCPLIGKSCFRRTEHLLEVEFFTPGPGPVQLFSRFQQNAEWDALELTNSSRTMVVGGKGAGKSTLCQFLVNRFIKRFGRILLVDLDIGQPLLFLPETISASVVHDPILGVGCFAQVKPLRSLLFGSLNVVSSPLDYIRNVRTLVEYCDANPELKGVPWIVNSMGYVSGFGEELIAAIIRLVQPTDLITLTIPKHVKGATNYEHMPTVDHVNGYRFNMLVNEMHEQEGNRRPLNYKLHVMDVCFEQRGTTLSAPKRRTLSITARLVRILRNSTERFTDVKPTCAALDDLQIHITRDECSSSEQRMADILNAMMVYLCEPLDNSTQYNCLGIGIVRAVDHNNIVYLLHSLPPEQLSKAKVLALCNTSLPSQVYLQLNSKLVGTVPYLENVG